MTKSDGANLCCLVGISLVLYAAFLVHNALGCLCLGTVMLIGGIRMHRRDSAVTHSDKG